MYIKGTVLTNSLTISILRRLLTITVLSGFPDAALAQVDFTLLSTEDPNQTYETIAITQKDQFAIATHDTGITAWDLKSGREVYSVAKELQDVLYDRSGNRLLFTDSASSALQELKIDGPPEDWAVRTLLTEFDDRKPLAISPDGRCMGLEMGYDSFGFLDLTTQELVLQLRLKNVQKAAFSPQGTQIALTFDRPENAVVTYSFPDGKLANSSASFLSSASRLAYSADGELLAVTCRMGNDKCVALLESGRLRPIRGARFPIDCPPENCAIDWSDDGAYLAASSAYGSDTSIGVYDVLNKKRLALLRGYEIDALAMNADGSRAASVSDKEPGVVWWDWQADLRFREAKRTIASHPRLDQHRDDRNVDLRLRFSPDGNSLALSIPKPAEYGAHQPLQATDEPGAGPVFDFSQLDEDVAYIFLLDVTSGKPIKAMWSKAPEFKDEDDDYIDGELFESLGFSRDGKTLATLFCDGPGSSGHLVLWDVASVRPRVQLLVKTESNTWRDGWIDLEYGEDGKSLLLLPDDHDDLGVQWFDLATSSVKSTVRGEFADSLLLLPNGRFASGFATWDYVNGDALHRQNSSYADDYHPLARAAGETIVGVYRDEQLGRWDLDTLKTTFPYAAHRNSDGIQIHALASSPNGQLVATGCADHLIRLWESATGRLLLNLRGHRRAVDALCFSPDGKMLASASRDGATRFWDVSDVGTATPNIERPELPTRRTFRTTTGATVTVAFDRPASQEEIVSALQEVQSQLGK